MSATEIKIGGLGGQGVILAGMIIGRAASIFDGKYATLTQSFGPEARGSACSAQVIVATEPVSYPYVVRPDILVVMSKEACTRFQPELADDGLLLYEEDLVQAGPLHGRQRAFAIPATRIAEQLRRRMVLNIVMVGFFTALSDLIGVEAMRKSVDRSVPKGTEELNLEAFARGYEFGMELKHRSEAAALRQDAGAVR